MAGNILSKDNAKFIILIVIWFYFHNSFPRCFTFDCKRGSIIMNWNR